MRMVLFADIHDGRLNRLRFPGYCSLLAILPVLGGVSVGFGVCIAEHLIGGDLVTAQNNAKGGLLGRLLPLMRVTRSSPTTGQTSRF